MERRSAFLDPASFISLLTHLWLLSPSVTNSHINSSLASHIYSLNILTWIWHQAYAILMGLQPQQNLWQLRNLYHLVLYAVKPPHLNPWVDKNRVAVFPFKPQWINKAWIINRATNQFYTHFSTQRLLWLSICLSFYVCPKPLLWGHCGWSSTASKGCLWVKLRIWLRLG